jgi:DNA topoisomerase-2
MATTEQTNFTEEEQYLIDTYQDKTEFQHVLDNPDTYIGSVEEIDSDMWCMDDTNSKIIEKNIKYIPGLFKLFDEGIVNCRDHVMRMKEEASKNIENTIQVSEISITIENDLFTMINDGNGLDVAIHPVNQLWIPELMFGHMRKSRNFNKDEKKIVGGKNGFGFKLVLIWSSYGCIETVDHKRGLKYTQEFKNNLSEICPPVITKCKSKPYTKVIFKPDYARLRLGEGLTPDVISLLHRRVYDIAAITDKSIKVKYNSSIVPIKNFQQYIDLYIGNKTNSVRVYEESGERWEYAVALTPNNEFTHISFVNGIHTSKGGKHVEYILNQITKKICDFIEKKKKIVVNAKTIKEQLFLFLRCDIENPAFDSQSKDYMNTAPAKFGSKCEVSDKFIENIIKKLGVMETACKINEIKETKEAKKTDGAKKTTITGIPKLRDAFLAGTKKSNLCTIIFCEGDSAKTGIVSGLSQEHNETIGVYPLKGKLLNVRGENNAVISKNKEITEIKKILGLENKKEYHTIEDVYKDLRYGRVVFITDQDLDGSHIKGLGINLFHSLWKTLTKIPGFICFMNTPILKATFNKKEMLFYSDGEYEQWKQDTANASSWTTKYYKGLGTSTKQEFQKYFANPKIVELKHSGEVSDDSIDMLFNDGRANDRKVLLKNYNRKLYLDTTKPDIFYEEFINKELIHFSKYNCDRSIPNIMDGLKISLRKILFAAFKKNLTTEIKVAQFSGYVSEHSAYHHGEASLNNAIVGMAQNFVGSNNINLLNPNGQFGTRLQGGDDSASERYIFTCLTKITRIIFNEFDDDILTYLDDDGLSIEPIYYAPIIPMILINGSKGLGTGFSTEILCYNPLQIIQYLTNKLEINDALNENTEFIPYYEGFKGAITKIGDSKFLIKGLYRKIDENTIQVTELPVGHWTQDFKELLDSLCEPSTDKNGVVTPALLKSFKELSGDIDVNFIITFQNNKLEELEGKMDKDQLYNGLEKALKLYKTVSTTNMHLFNQDEVLQKYESVSEIIDSYYEKRLEMYQQRKDFLIQKYEQELVELSNKLNYINENIEGTIDLRRKTNDEVTQLLSSKNYSLIDGNYKYLIHMKMNSVTEENALKIKNEYESKNNELTEIRNKTSNFMWLQELNKLKSEYSRYVLEREHINKGEKNEEKAEEKKKVIIKKKVMKATSTASAV